MRATARRAGLAIYRHHAAEPGGATRVVFVHGSLDRGALAPPGRHGSCGRDVVRYDRRGYGRSAEAGTTWEWTAMVADLVVVLDGQPSVVVGHSLGGVIALAAAQHHPHLVTAVATFEAPSPWLDWWPGRSAGGRALEFADRGPEEVAERFLRGLVGSGPWEALPRGDEGGAPAGGPGAGRRPDGDPRRRAVLDRATRSARAPRRHRVRLAVEAAPRAVRLRPPRHGPGLRSSS